ncbi:MAG TPA: electron transporter YccM [Solibacterales bacterium]|nr:electron transporter YccM [Bryobacterales bacterium]
MATVLDAPAPAKQKKKLVRRTLRDRSQAIRRTVQVLFLALNVWIGVEFYLFVRYFESGEGAQIDRPSGVDGWLPIASLMNLKQWVLTGDIPQSHPAGMFLLLAFAGVSLVFRKAFCSWLCPVGTVSEYLWKVGRETFRRNFAAPRWLDLPLRSLKYILLGLFGYAVYSMSPLAIRQFMESPYGIISDVKMLNFFRDLSVTAAAVLALLVLGSFFVQNLWCRYLCPYGALMGLVSLLSPARIRREAGPCIDCGKCAKACPSLLPVDQLVQIRSAECTGCLECVAVCPAEGALSMVTVPAGRSVPPWVMAAGMAAIFFGVTGAAIASGHWDMNVPLDIYRSLVPRAHEFGHP